MSYKHLTFIQRCHIYSLWQAGHSQVEIAKAIGVHKSTICREFKRNVTYLRTLHDKPHYAQTYVAERHKNKPKAIKFTKAVEDFVRNPLKEAWSPEQMSGYAKRHQLFSIRHERIYQYILEDKKQGGHPVSTPTSSV